MPLLAIPMHAALMNRRFSSPTPSAVQCRDKRAQSTSPACPRCPSSIPHLPCMLRSCPFLHGSIHNRQPNKFWRSDPHRKDHKCASGLGSFNTARSNSVENLKLADLQAWIASSSCAGLLFLFLPSTARHTCSWPLCCCDWRTSFYAAIDTGTKAIVKQKHKYTPTELNWTEMSPWSFFFRRKLVILANCEL